MPIVKRLGGLDLEDSAAVDKEVGEINLLKTIEADLDRDFDASTATMGQFSLINAFIEEAAKLAMYVERVPHHLKRNATEFILR